MKRWLQRAILKLMNFYCFKFPWHTDECEHCILSYIEHRDGCLLEHFYQKVEKWNV